jgi:hypothetical protein
MTASVIAASLWLIAGNLLGMLPSRRNHWPQAWALIATGLPILVWVTLAAGPFVAALFFVAAASVLRWPLFFLWRWLRDRLRPGGQP